MFTRGMGYLIVPAWVAAMAWLFAHDVLPGLTAGDPPPIQVSDWLRREGRQAQFVIRDENHNAIGSVWTVYKADEFFVKREDTIWIEEFPLPIAPLRLHIDSSFSSDGALDEFTALLNTDDAWIELHGERFHADFSFRLDGDVSGKRLDTTFKLPLVDGALLSSGFNPFNALSGLHVGQVWRMQVFNPLWALLGVGDRFMLMLVRVTGEEAISTAAGPAHCFVLESKSARAWVDRVGIVWMQEIEFPMVGKLRVIRETSFDESEFQKIRRWPFKNRRTGRL